MPFVYILTNRIHTVLYTGVCRELASRIEAHRAGTSPKAFSHRYQTFKLVYFEEHQQMMDAIRREKQIKAGSRADKEALIHSLNPYWKELMP